ncbi:hypothetical protein Hanom_Chr01g00073331 [Helianthus anomalus]
MVTVKSNRKFNHRFRLLGWPVVRVNLDRIERGWGGEERRRLRGVRMRERRWEKMVMV